MQSRYFDNVNIGAEAQVNVLKAATLAVASITEISGTLSHIAGDTPTAEEINAVIDRLNELTAAINLIAGTAAT